ncbi:toprim domain-containing protein [Meridianimarinicoccus aquatilis]|uniref:Uncharacterized protein n=1 Tax=Meridianimarinicoccus aquatilis TaxID=2552766 RepID=A0A4R6AEV4_9RHOB|nr:toprim domain-containing protein [Fluviibacterium aquatile]TDL81685.1 hypothetical protein E2L05_19985 [Fluviibacterium aquatile]
MAHRKNKNGAQPPIDAAWVKEALQDQAENLFRQVWGEPTKPGKSWRPCESSARSMVMQGPRRGFWTDHKAGTGGDLLDLFAIEICGLNRARDDFPTVLAEAARWCGLNPDAPPDLSILETRRAERDAALGAQDKADKAHKTETVQVVLNAAQRVTESPAAAYLSARGVTALPDFGLAYAPPLTRTPGIAKPDRAALVVWATDDTGKMMGGQRVLILPDGKPAPEDPRKLSFGAIGGYPARFPAQVQGGPLCIAEGPETALSIWQATGFETWAVFGAGQFETAPVPTDRKVILCPDQDAPDSPAGKAFAKALVHHSGRGAELWVARAPEPEGSKRDLNDTLQRAGRKAVLRALEGGQRFTAPRGKAGRYTGAGAFEAEPVQMPDFVSPETARAMIREAVKSFLVKVGNWHGQRADADAAQRAWEKAFERFEVGKADKPEELPPEVLDVLQIPAPVLVIRATPGTGKSRIAREVLAEFDLSSLPGDVVFTTPTLNLAEEAAGHARELGAGDHVTRGRNAALPGPGHNSREKLCARPELADRVAKTTGHVQANLCERREEGKAPVRCPFYEGCNYVSQWQHLPDKTPVLRFEASQYLTLPGDGSKRETALRVIDESVWQLFTRQADIPLDAWTRPRRPRAGATPEETAQAAGTAQDATKAASAVLSGLQDGNSPLVGGYTATDYAAFREAERGSNFLQVMPDAPEEQIARELKELEGFDPYATKRAAVWAILQDCAERGLNTSERLRIVRDIPAHGTGEKRDVIRANWFKEPPRDVPALLLDADADPVITERLFPGAEIVQVDLRPNAKVVQITDKTFSKTSLKSPTLRKEVAEMVRAEVYRDRLSTGGGVLAIASREVVRWMFEDQGHDFTEKTNGEISDFMRKTPLHGAHWLWFGPGSLGLNTWQDHTTAIVFGREELPLYALQDYARGLFGDTKNPLQLVPETPGANLPEVTLPYVMSNGSGAAVQGRAAQDPRVRSVQLQTRELRTRQAFERLRLANAPQCKRLVIACKVPVPGLPVDQLVSWKELAPTRAEAAIAEAAQRGGVLRLTSAGLAADAPETFATEKAAAQWLDRGGRAEIYTPHTGNSNSIRGVGVLNPVQAQIRLKGQRGPKPTPALIVLPGDPQAQAEAYLGPLSMFEIIGSAKQAPDPVPVDYETNTRARGSPKRLVILPEAERLNSSLPADHLRMIAAKAAARPRSKIGKFRHDTGQPPPVPTFQGLQRAEVMGF